MLCLYQCDLCELMNEIFIMLCNCLLLFISWKITHIDWRATQTCPTGAAYLDKHVMDTVLECTQQRWGSFPSDYWVLSSTGKALALCLCSKCKFGVSKNAAPAVPLVWSWQDAGGWGGGWRVFGVQEQVRYYFQTKDKQGTELDRLCLPWIANKIIFSDTKQGA